MKELLGWTARQVNRRNFIRGSTVAVFSTLAGLATAKTAYAHVTCNPIGGVYCNEFTGVCAKSGHCQTSSQMSCSPLTTYYPHSGGCWSSGGYLCCDCSCYTPAGGGQYINCTCGGG
jgi:hypothetical protein